MPDTEIREGLCDSEKVDKLSATGERFFTRALLKSDDCGRLDARPAILLSLLFPLKRNMKEESIISAMDECLEIGPDGTSLIYIYIVSGKRYLQINNFKARRGVNSVALYPDPVLAETVIPAQKIQESSESENSAQNFSKPTESGTFGAEFLEEKGGSSPLQSPSLPQKEASPLVLSFPDLPANISYAYYQESWNGMARAAGLPSVEEITDARRDKLKTRKFPVGVWTAILAKITESDFLRGKNERGWRVTFDWVIHNDTRYVRIMEGAFADSGKTAAGMAEEAARRRRVQARELLLQSLSAGGWVEFSGQDEQLLTEEEKDGLEMDEEHARATGRWRYRIRQKVPEEDAAPAPA